MSNAVVKMKKPLYLNAWSLAGGTVWGHCRNFRDQSLDEGSWSLVAGLGAFWPITSFLSVDTV